MVYKVKEETITGIANAIRTKTNSEENIQVEDFAEEILNIETGENTTAAAQSAKDAAASAISADSSAQAAADSAAEAAASAKKSLDKVNEAKDWAVGETESAKYYAEEAAKDADEAHNSYIGSYNVGNYILGLQTEIVNTISTAQGFTAEAWAIGTKNGEPVVEGDPQYNEHAKYYAGKAAEEADRAKSITENFARETIAGNVFADNATVSEVTP